MAENRVQIVIVADSSKAVKNIRMVSDEFDRFKSSACNSIAGTNSAISSMGAGLASAISLLQGFAAAMAAAKAAEIGLGFNKEVEDARLGIATLLAAQGQFVDQQGQQLQGQQRINSALAYSADLTRQLQVDNLRTTATFQQLLKAFQQTLSPGLSEGLSVDQVRQYTLAMVQAASAMQIPLDMMAEETRSLLKGTITPRNTLIATALGITPEEIRKLQGDAEGLFTFIMGKLQAFQDFGQVTQTTYSGLLSNAKDALANVLGKASEPFFESFKASLQRFIDYAIQVDAVTGNMKLNPELIDSAQILNDLLRASLTVAEALVKTLEVAGRAYSAIKNALPSGAPTYDSTDVFAMQMPTSAEERLVRVKELMAEITETKRILDVNMAKNTPDPLLKFYMSSELDKSAASLENFRIQMVATGQDTSELDAFLKGLKQSSDAVAAAQETAAGSVGNFSFAANNAAMSADRFKEKLKELAHMDAGQLGRAFAGEIEKNWARIKVLSEGGDAGLANLEARIRERQRKWETESYWANYLNVEPSEKERIAAEGKSAELLAWQDRYIHGMERRAKGAGKGGASASPIDIDKIDKDILQFTERMQKLYSELEDLDSEYRIARLEQSGRFYDAEAERLDRQAAKRKEAFAKEVADAEQAYLEMEQKLSGGRGGTAEAWAQLAELKSKWDAAKKAAQEYGDKIDRNLQLTKDVKKAEDDAKRAEDLAQLNLEYGKLTGTLQEQLALQILLLRAEKDRKLLAADPALRAAVERNYAAMEKELIIERSGSFWDNFFLAAEKYKRTLPAIGQMGKSAFETLVRGIESASDALAQFTMTGEMDFENFSNSILRDILRMQYQALLTQMILGSAGSASGGGGILGWLMDLFKGGGMTTASGRYWDSSMNFYEHHSGGIAGGSGSSTRNAPAWLLSRAPRLHDGLAPDEFPAILQRGERVLSRRETRDYGAANRAPEVVVNVQNKTNTPVTADKTRAAFDGKRYVVDVILDDYSRGGDVWKMIRGNRNG